MKRAADKRPASVDHGFEDDCVTLPIDLILPLRALGKSAKASRKYRQIVASIAQIGIVEPPVVVPNPDKSATWLLLDGHLRIEALKDDGVQEVECLVSTDDEAFTYNRQVSRLAPIQEHRMIRKAIKRGVPEEKIAAALDLGTRSIQKKIKLLDGISEEAIAILKDKPATGAVFDALRKMKTMRQIEAAELLVNANNYSVAYVKAILAGTPQAQLVEASKPKKVKGITPEAMARMEQELARLQEGIASIQDTYGQDHLHLTVIKAYISKLLGNARVVRYLMQTRPEFLSEFQTIAEMASVAPAEAE
ncbi:plasmid partitioning protein RepB C-terminal domain-containing protein [Rhodovulum sulfidophilum]|uniref:plasmid partitioning protein RepB C-terminal domain-containing protein n=1 Tax=Rhodovulum sulfidophilum TaxID=35806 RepID=UPI00138A2211|nr:plasmid partitioning protein RepB C-terminal domain-containing protein [Rhodovulum sulfidophilum]NDK33917.1 ParB N-terminal domain-containing protein [Rhodovulum sulfidophilum]